MKVFAVLLILFSIGSLFTAQSPYAPSQETSTTTTSTFTTYTWGITVSTDKSTYSSGETVVVSGTVTGVGYLCGTGTTCTFTNNIIIELEIRDPLSATVHSKNLSLYPPSLPDEPPIRSYNDSFNLSSDLTSGTYQVNVHADWNGSTAYASSSFRLEGTATTRDCGHWVVATDKGAYSTGEIVHITGHADTPCMTFGFGTAPAIRLNYSSGSLEIQSQPWPGTTCTTCGSGGSDFYADWQIPSTFSSGTVAITVFDPTMPNIAAGATTFIITTASTLGNLSVNFDKTTYHASDTVHITGGISTSNCTWTYTSAGGLAVAITIYDPNGLLVLNSTTNPSAASYKQYAYDYALPVDAVAGRYTIDVSYGYSCGGGRIFGQGAFQVVPTTPVTTPVTTPATTPAPQPSPGRCVIATAAYGSEMAPDVVYMRYVRDNLIGSSPIGRTLVAAFNVFYYSWSPSVASVIAGNEPLQAIFRVVLLPLIGIVHITALLFTTMTYLAGSRDLASVVAFLVAAAMAVAVYVAFPVLVALEIRQGSRRWRA